MSISLVQIDLCERCSEFAPRMEMLKSDNIAYQTEIYCENYSKCKSALEYGKKLNEAAIVELRKESYKLEEKNKELKSFMKMLLSDIQKYGEEVTGIEFTSYRGINLEELLKGE